MAAAASAARISAGGRNGRSRPHRPLPREAKPLLQPPMVKTQSFGLAIFQKPLAIVGPSSPRAISRASRLRLARSSREVVEVIGPIRCVQVGLQDSLPEGGVARGLPTATWYTRKIVELATGKPPWPWRPQTARSCCPAVSRV